MSTNALIGLLKPDGRVVSIYSHSDGYPEYLGALLNEHYLNINKVKKLMQMGDVSILGRNLEPCEAVRRFGFDGLFSQEARKLPQDEYNRLRDDYLSSDYSRFYTRDRGEYTPAKVYQSLDGWLEQRFPYQYLYYQGVWYAYDQGEPIDILTGEPVDGHNIPNFTKKQPPKIKVTFTHEDALKAAKNIIKYLNGSNKSGVNTLVVTISGDAVKLDFKDERSQGFKEISGDVYTVIYPTSILFKPHNPKSKQKEPVVQTQTFLQDMLYKTINASIIKYKVSR